MNVVDKKKLLEWVFDKSYNIGDDETWIIDSPDLKALIESGELDPDPVKDFLCVNCGKIVPLEDHKDHIGDNCEPSLLEEGMKECFPGVEFVTSGEKK
jgi:hypothetical protein